MGTVMDSLKYFFSTVTQDGVLLPFLFMVTAIFIALWVSISSYNKGLNYVNRAYTNRILTMGYVWTLRFLIWGLYFISMLFTIGAVGVLLDMRAKSLISIGWIGITASSVYALLVGSLRHYFQQHPDYVLNEK